jgi:Iap family predicted aminopeptidase
MTQEWLLQQLEDLPVDNAARGERLKALFEEMGCTGENLTTHEVKRNKTPNIACTLPGTSTDTIVVGAHFDKTKAGRGTADNGTGMLLLPALYKAISEQSHKHTYLFVGFAEEEVGLVGSHAYVAAIPKADRSRFRAMVNIDTLGLGPVTVWARHSHPMLIQWFARLANALKIEKLSFVNVDEVGDSDSSSFKQIGVPVIDFHSITQETFKILHTDRDNMSAIKRDDYYEAYKQIAYYLGFLDYRVGELPLRK